MKTGSDNHSRRESERGITIRRLEAADAVAVRELAGRDSAPIPHGECLGIELDGRLLAMQPLAYGGVVIADPFACTGELRALLELRSSQLRARAAARPRLADRAPADGWTASAQTLRAAS